jgi:NAD+ synthase
MDISSQYKIMINGAVNAGVSYLRDNPGIKALILGISGGVDSAVVAAIARKVCDVLLKEGRKVNLSGYSLNILSNKKDEIERASVVGRTYCNIFNEENLGETFLRVLGGIDPLLYIKYVESLGDGTLTSKEKIRMGNIKARIRMAFLYNKAQEQEGLVLSTDNLTEYYLGFWTLHGDVGDLGLIQELWKTEVFGMADVIGQPVLRCANAVPTDGLGITDSDIDQLLPEWTPEMGSYIDAYKVVDDILISYLNGTHSGPEDHPVIQRYEASKFKRTNPVNIKRDMLLWRHLPTV